MPLPQGMGKYILATRTFILKTILTFPVSYKNRLKKYYLSPERNYGYWLEEERQPLGFC